MLAGQGVTLNYCLVESKNNQATVVIRNCGIHENRKSCKAVEA